MSSERLMQEVRETLWQYESDLLHPPLGDSRDRRLERVRAVTAKIDSALVSMPTVVTGEQPQDLGDYALPPLQPASGFIEAMADRFQEKHIPPLPRDRALLLALTAMKEAEADLGPINHPDFDWSLDGAQIIADETIEHWEAPAC